MNKSQELDMMVLRAERNAEEAMKQHEDAWHGEKPIRVEEGDNAETEND